MPRPRPEPPPLRAGDVVNDWCVSRELGHGATGTVYLAEKNGQLGAMKIYTQQISRDGTSGVRVQTEATRVGQIRHPNVCAVYEHGRTPIAGELDSARLYLVMEYIEGRSLTEEIERGGPLDDQALRALGIKLCDALAAMHDVGLIHRDIKPDNVLIEAKSGRVVVADFGVVNDLQDATRTAQHVFLGTLQYSASEHIFRDPPEAVNSTAIDVYGVGATLLHAATGHEPYPGIRNAYELAELIKTTPPTIDAPSLTADMARAIRSATARDPQARPTISMLRQTLSEPATQRRTELASNRDRLRELLATDERFGRARDQSRRQQELAEATSLARGAVVEVLGELRESLVTGTPTLRVSHGNGIELQRWRNGSALRAAVPGFALSDAENVVLIVDTYGGHGALLWVQVDGGPMRFECVAVVAEWTMQSLAPGSFLLDTLKTFSGTRDEICAALREAMPSFEDALIRTMLDLNERERSMRGSA